MTHRSVSELAAAISETTQHLTPEPIWITGTLTTWKTSRSWTRGELAVYRGTNPAAKLQLGCPTNIATRIRKSFAAQNKNITAGIDISVLGQLEFDPVYGMRINVKTIAANTAKDSQTSQDRLALITQLHQTGIGTRQQQLPTPQTIRTVGLISPISGDAARADALAILGTHNIIIDERRVPTEGPQAATAICKALGQLEPIADIILCVRGGGSSAGLTVFDDQRVATAIGTCLKPVIVGIGHATDQHIATDIAHHGATTPTAAAQWIATQLTPAPTSANPESIVETVIIHQDRPAPIRLYIVLVIAAVIIAALLTVLIAQNLNL